MNYFIAIVIILKLIALSFADTVECKYNLNGLKLRKFQMFENEEYFGYTCEIKDIQIGEINSELMIEGDHMIDKNDEDMRYFSAIRSFRNQNDGHSRKLDSKICKKFKNLKGIVINRFKINEITEDALQNCRNLQLFSFEINNDLKIIPQNLIRNNLKLRDFSINQSKVKNFYQNFFKYHRRMEVLSLIKNQITIVNPVWFEDMRNLEALSLDQNQIKAINENDFESLGYLKTLILNDNNIIIIHKDAFSTLTDLRILSLTKNQIETLHSDLFKSLENLNYLALGYNKISELPRNIFSRLGKLETLGLDHNQLTVIHSDSFGTRPVLTKLYLGTNKINAIDERLFDNTAVSKIYIFDNTCISFSSSTNQRSKVKELLKKCFINYQPRPVESIHTVEETATEANMCGAQKLGKGLIVHGTETKHGEYPWSAALLDTSKKIFCGGTLISNKLVLTAAHCVEEKFSDSRKRSRDIIVLLGAHKLNQPLEVGRTSFGVQKIVVHDDWIPNSSSYDADIALLELASNVYFTDFIQPICLVHSYTVIASIVEGIALGLGKNENGTGSNIAHTIKSPIISHRNCSKSVNHQGILSNRMFCGGNADGTGVCAGDSGSGLYVVYNKKYYLRGIVSASIGYGYDCNLDEHALFTDVSKFYNWISSGGSNYN